MKLKKKRKAILPGLKKIKKKANSTCGCGKHKKQQVMSLDDIKIFALNGTTFAISVSSAETVLKIVLLVISIFYTAHKWYASVINRKKNKQQ